MDVEYGHIVIFLCIGLVLLALVLLIFYGLWKKGVLKAGGCCSCCECGCCPRKSVADLEYDDCTVSTTLSADYPEFETAALSRQPSVQSAQHHSRFSSWQSWSKAIARLYFEETGGKHSDKETSSSHNEEADLKSDQSS